MSISNLARANAIPLEVKKDGLQQRQNGDWVLRLVIQAADMDQRITSAPMGTRFMAALVEVGDDELPKEQPAPPEVKAEPAPKAKKSWREQPPAQQAGIRCDEPIFIAFLKETYPEEWREFEDAAEFVRFYCGVKSRSELNTIHKSQDIWHQLDSQFQAWKTAESVA